MKAFVGAVVVAAVILVPGTPEVAPDRVVIDSGTLVGEGAE